MKQRIVIPSKITHSVFNLPCVHCVRKGIGGPIYYIKDEGYAKPGDILVEDGRGRWSIERKEGR